MSQKIQWNVSEQARENAFKMSLQTTEWNSDFVAPVFLKQNNLFVNVDGEKQQSFENYLDEFLQNHPPLQNAYLGDEIPTYIREIPHLQVAPKTPNSFNQNPPLQKAKAPVRHRVKEKSNKFIRSKNLLKGGAFLACLLTYHQAYSAFNPHQTSHNVVSDSSFARKSDMLIAIAQVQQDVRDEIIKDFTKIMADNEGGGLSAQDILRLLEARAQGQPLPDGALPDVNKGLQKAIQNNWKNSQKVILAGAKETLEDAANKKTQEWKGKIFGMPQNTEKDKKLYKAVENIYQQHDEKVKAAIKKALASLEEKLEKTIISLPEIKTFSDFETKVDAASNIVDGATAEAVEWAIDEMEEELTIMQAVIDLDLLIAFITDGDPSKLDHRLTILSWSSPEVAKSIRHLIDKKGMIDNSDVPQVQKDTNIAKQAIANHYRRLKLWQQHLKDDGFYSWCVSSNSWTYLVSAGSCTGYVSGKNIMAYKYFGSEGVDWDALAGMAQGTLLLAGLIVAPIAVNQAAIMAAARGITVRALVANGARVVGGKVLMGTKVVSAGLWHGAKVVGGKAVVAGKAAMRMAASGPTKALGQNLAQVATSKPAIIVGIAAAAKFLLF